MRKFKLLSLILLFVSITNLFSQDIDYPKLKPLKSTRGEIILYPKEKKGKWGYANERGRFKIKPLFDTVTEFENGVSKLQYNEKWGVINKTGEYVFPPIFDSLIGFARIGDVNHRAWVRQNSKQGLISSSGDFIIPCEYDEIRSTSVKNISYLVNKSSSSQELIGIVNIKDGHIILKPESQTIDLSLFDKHGICIVKKANKASVVNSEGIVVYGPYDEIWPVESAVRGQKSLSYVIKEGDKYAITKSGAPVFCYYDVEYVPSGKTAGYRSLRNEKTNTPSISCYGLVGDFGPDDNNLVVYNSYGIEMPKRVNYAPRFNQFGNALMRGVDSCFYVLYDSKLYSFKDYNVLMEKTSYSKDNVLPEWARIYSTKDVSVEGESDDSIPKFELASFLWTYSINEGYYQGEGYPEEYLFAFGIKSRSGDKWALKPVLEESPQRTKWGWTVYPCKSDNRSTVVSHRGKYGAVKRNGELLAPVVFNSYDEIQRHDCYKIGNTDYYAIWETDKIDDDGYYKYGIIDSKGNTIIPKEYFCYPYYDYGDLGICYSCSFPSPSSGLFIISTKDSNNPKKLTWGIIDNDNIVREPLIHSFEEAMRIRTETGSSIIKNKLLAPVYTNNGEWAVIDTTGKYIVEPGKYFYIRSFSEGYAAVKKDSYGDWRFINKFGEEITDTGYEEVGDFCEGMAAVETDGRWGFINEKGEMVIPCKYDDARSFSEGLALVYDDRYGYIDKNGKEVIPCTFIEARDFKEGLAMIYKDGKYGYINNKGKIVIPCVYSRASDFGNGFASVNRWISKSDGLGEENQQFLINKKGHELKTIYFDDLYEASEGLRMHSTFFVLENRSFYGYLNANGENILLYEYYDAGNFKNGLAPVEKKISSFEHKWGFINKKKKVIIPFQFEYAYSFSEGRALVERDQRWGFIDIRGQEIIPCKYHEAKDYKSGFAPVRSKEGWGFVDKSGRVIIKCQFEGVSWFE